MRIERGIHTFSLTAPCSYHTIQELCEDPSRYVHKKSSHGLKKRHDITILVPILRMELRVSDQRMRKLAGKGNWEDQLRQLSKDQDFPQVVHKKETFKRIEESGFQQSTKEKIRALIKKISSCGSFTAARQKMGLGKKSFIQLLEKFEKIKISPITVKSEIKVLVTGYQNGV